jgi:DNA-directed RNA polymerase subunit RPC12/RpoP
MSDGSLVVYECPYCGWGDAGPEGEEGNYVCPDCGVELEVVE